MKSLKAGNPTRPGEICLECGLCCDGSLFADVKLQPADDAGKLISLGLPLAAHASKKKTKLEPPEKAWRLPQPCAAFDGCRCRIYSSRPSYCQRFECLVLRQLHSGTIARANAERLIRRARHKATLVDELLRELGQDDSLGLADRFRALTKRLERKPLDSAAAERYAELTQVFHELNLLLFERFYPSPGDGP